MAQQNRTTLKGYFNTGDTPTEAQFADLIDSFHNPSDDGAVQVQPSEGAFANGDKTKLDGIEAGADVTDTANVTAAGAVMDSEVTDLAGIKALDTSTLVTLTGTQTLTNKTIAATQISLADAGGLITATQAEAAFQEAFTAIDANASDIATISAAYIDRDDIDIYQKIGTNASDARTVSGVNLQASDTVIWIGYSTKPTNMGDNDIWLGPPGSEYNAKTANYTLVLDDGNRAIGMNVGSANTLTIPANSAVAFPIGTEVYVTQIGAGATTVEGATGVTVNGTSAGSVVLEQYQTALLRKIASDTWIVETSTPASALKADTSDQLTAGFSAAIVNDGTQSSGTYTPAFATGNYKRVVNGGAFTLAPPSPGNDEAISIVLLITNNASAGAITTSGFSDVSGDSFTTTDGDDFICFIDVMDAGGTEYSSLTVKALQ